MWEAIKANVLAPSTTRIGTFAAGLLVSAGMNADHANQVGIGIAVLGLWVGDLALAYVRKQRIIHRTLSGLGLGNG